MHFGTAIKTCLRNYAVFSGRARRSEYWYFFLFGVLANIAAGIVQSMIVATTGIFAPVGWVVWLALLLPALAVNVRRLHDTDRSGLAVVGFYLYCFAALAAMWWWSLMRAPTVPYGGTESLISSGLAVLIGLAYAIFLFVLTVLPGTSGTNRYGPDPKAPMVDVF
jgi:uncharacterized membrane protein YhaH (DUF805 family)